MTRMDPRTLSPETQEDLRRRVVYSMLVDKLGPVAAAKLHGCSYQSASKWRTLAKTQGMQSLRSRKRGPKPSPRIAAEDERAIRWAIRNDCPDQLLLPFALWSREAVVDLIKKQTGRVVSVWTAGRYLKRWGYTPQKPMRRAFERDEQAVRRWLNAEYPQIKARAKRQNARIFWGDEMGLRSDDQIGRSFAPRGKTPINRATGRRFGCSMISAISNLGELRFMVFKGKFDARRFIDFLSRLLKSTGEQRLFLIIDSHPVHKSRKVKTWIESDADRMRRLTLHFLPGYSPELNPDECLNQDTKQAMRRHRPRHEREMISKLRGHLSRRQKQPGIVKKFFHERHVSYAA